MTGMRRDVKVKEEVVVVGRWEYYSPFLPLKELNLSDHVQLRVKPESVARCGDWHLKSLESIARTQLYII